MTRIAVSTAGADVQWKPSDVTEYVVAEKTSVIHIYKRICNLCGSAAVNRRTPIHGQKYPQIIWKYRWPLGEENDGLRNRKSKAS